MRKSSTFDRWNKQDASQKHNKHRKEPRAECVIDLHLSVFRQIWHNQQAAVVPNYCGKISRNYFDPEELTGEKLSSL